mmetsp:Transcript_36948/g.92644  ORF Transcript_36948/g.92644 Transcript_36948/m.92644 type:complete len:246 (-) Transcript_36948:506-1243(-)
MQQTQADEVLERLEVDVPVEHQRVVPHVLQRKELVPHHVEGGQGRAGRHAVLHLARRNKQAHVEDGQVAQKKSRGVLHCDLVEGLQQCLCGQIWLVDGECSHGRPTGCQIVAGAALEVEHAAKGSKQTRVIKGRTHTGVEFSNECGGKGRLCTAARRKGEGVQEHGREVCRGRWGGGHNNALAEAAAHALLQQAHAVQVTCEAHNPEAHVGVLHDVQEPVDKCLPGLCCKHLELIHDNYHPAAFP